MTVSLHFLLLYDGCAPAKPLLSPSLWQEFKSKGEAAEGGNGRGEFTAGISGSCNEKSSGISAKKLQNQVESYMTQLHGTRIDTERELMYSP